MTTEEIQVVFCSTMLAKDGENQGEYRHRKGIKSANTPLNDLIDHLLYHVNQTEQGYFCQFCSTLAQKKQNYDPLTSKS